MSVSCKALEISELSVAVEIVTELSPERITMALSPCSERVPEGVFWELAALHEIMKIERNKISFFIIQMFFSVH